MPAVFSKLSLGVSQNFLSATSLAIIFIIIFHNHRKQLRQQSCSEKNVSKINHKEKSKCSDKAQVDRNFFLRLWQLFKILNPGLFTPETGCMLLIAVMLLSRTYCDVWIIHIGTAIESAIIGGNSKLFFKHLKGFALAMPTISLINNVLKFGLSELKLRFRKRLTSHLYSLYMDGFTYYQMNNLDNRISNVDQLLTQDVEKFCSCVADLYSNLSKPVLDTVIYVVQLATSIGFQAPGYMLLYLVASGLLLTRLRKPLGQLTMTEQQLEGEYRSINSRLITNSEEIAFYRGNKPETFTMETAFAKLMAHLHKVIRFRFEMGILDNIVAKYLATVIGYLVVSRPFLRTNQSSLASHTHSERLQFYYENGRMLVRLAVAIGGVVLSGRELTRLAGYTVRISKLLKVLKELGVGRYKRTMVNCTIANETKCNGQSNADCSRSLIDESLAKEKLCLDPSNGTTIIEDHIISFENIPLATPNGDVLVHDLTFKVKSGENVIVCGPNGCGKSSLFRILGGLWPLFGGVLRKPSPEKLFYIPQRPYMTLGTLRGQIIYPDTEAVMHRKNVSDADLLLYLNKVSLGYLLDREGGWDALQDWMDVLSGGEKQRIAMARLFYHQPQFAILDECTSAVSVDVENAMYSYCREMKISLFTVSHRKSLWCHHEYFLSLDGRGSFEFREITADTMPFGS